MAETMTMRDKKKDEVEAIRKVKRLEYLKKREEKWLKEIRDDDVIEGKKYLFEYGKVLTEEGRKQLITDVMLGQLQTGVMSDEDRKEYRRIMRDVYGNGEGVGGRRLGE